MWIRLLNRLTWGDEMSVLNFLDKKCKAVVVFLFSLIAIGLFVFTTFFAMCVCTKGYGLIIGIVLMLLAIPFHILGKKNPIGYLISFLVNSVANGFSVSAYYLVKGIDIDLGSMIFAIIPAVAVLFIVYLMLQIWGKTKRVTVSVAVVVNVILIVAEIVLWIKNGSVPFSFGFFSLMISMFYLGVFGITINHDERAVLRDVSFGSFGSFIILTVVVIVILSEGDILEGLDFAGDGDNSGRKKKHKQVNTEKYISGVFEEK